MDYIQKNLIRKINESLKRLNTDYIDIYQLHNFDDYTPPNETFETLEQLKLEGKILNYGVSNYNKKFITTSKTRFIKTYLFKSSSL